LRTPPSSSTARTPPPAITPGTFGRRPQHHSRGIEAAEYLVGDRRAVLRIVNMFFFASSTAFVMASGTSRALP